MKKSKNNVFFQKSRRGKTLGNLVIQIDPATISALIQVSTSNAVYNSNGHQITWLDWLMTRGTKVVVEDFEFVSTDYDDKSRSGGGFMLPTGGVFRVDPKFAGTAGDNFITKAIIANDENIRRIIQEEFKRLF